MSRMCDFLKLIGMQLAVTAALAPSLALSDSNAPANRNALPEASTLEIFRNDKGDLLLGKVLPAQEFLNRKVVDQKGKTLGICKDLLLDLENGFVAFAWVSSASETDAYVLIPFSLVHLQNNTLSLDRASAEKIATARRWKGGSPKELTQVDQAGAFAHFAVQPLWVDGHSARNWGSDSNYGKLFRGADVQKLSGAVQAVEKVIPMPDMAAGTQLVIETDKGLIHVQLGPRSYLERHAMPFRVGEKVSISGVEANVEGHPVMIATEVHRGPRTLRLRTPSGDVVWGNAQRDSDNIRLTAASALRLMSVTNANSERLGHLVDLAIATEHAGRIAYAALKTTAESRKLYPIPLGAFIVEPGATSWTLDLPQDLLKNTPTFESGNWPAQVGAAWEEYTHVRFGRSALDGVHGETRDKVQSSSKADALKN